jgi:hypothetical protein
VTAPPTAQPFSYQKGADAASARSIMTSMTSPLISGRPCDFRARPQALSYCRGRASSMLRGYAWRGSTFDAARTYFTPQQIKRVIDLLALAKFNVLRLHLTDDWVGASRPDARRPNGNPTRPRTPMASCGILHYAQERFTTIGP